jgi:hypothetical protein
VYRYNRQLCHSPHQPLMMELERVFETLNINVILTRLCCQLYCYQHKSVTFTGSDHGSQRPIRWAHTKYKPEERTGRRYGTFSYCVNKALLQDTIFNCFTSHTVAIVSCTTLSFGFLMYIVRESSVKVEYKFWFWMSHLSLYMPVCIYELTPC